MRPVIGSDGKPVYAYSKGPPKARKPREDLEHQFQKQVRRYLDWALPPGYLWTSSAAGVRVGMQTAIKMKDAGVKKGWPDIQILFPNNVTRYIELKASSALRPDQRIFRDQCRSVKGRDIWALCRTGAEVQAAMHNWGVPMTRSWDECQRYAEIKEASSGG